MPNLLVAVIMLSFFVALAGVCIHRTSQWLHKLNDFHHELTKEYHNIEKTYVNLIEEYKHLGERAVLIESTRPTVASAANGDQCLWRKEEGAACSRLEKKQDE